MAERGLTLSEVEKTKITHISEGFDFLGFNIRKFPNNTLLTQPSSDAKKRFCDKIRKGDRKQQDCQTAFTHQNVEPDYNGLGQLL